MDQNKTRDLSGNGKLIVKVTTASGAIPIGDALVIVRRDSEGTDSQGDIISSMRTNSSGNTSPISLPAPPSSLSLSPSTSSVPIKPYENYNLEVHADLYYPQSYINIPVFDGITSIQPVDLIPLSENENSEGTKYSPFIYNENNNPKSL